MNPPYQFTKLDDVSPPKSVAPRRGLGDLIGAVATPVAAALGLPCVDPETKQLRPESPCAKRKAALNKAVPDVLHPLDKPVNK